MAFQEKQRKFFAEEGVLCTVTAYGARTERTVFASNGSPRRAIRRRICPRVITAENYNRIARLLQHEVPVKLSFDIKVKFDMNDTDRST